MRFTFYAHVERFTFNVLRFLYISLFTFYILLLTEHEGFFKPDRAEPTRETET